MFDILRTKRAKQIFDTHNIGLYVFAVIVLAVAWSGARTLQNNYELQKKISALQQQNTVLELQNQNTVLQNKYFQTDDYLDLAARQDLGLAAPGEQVLLVSRKTALKYVDETLNTSKLDIPAAVDSRSKYIKNIEDWRDFLLGRKASSG